MDFLKQIMEFVPEHLRSWEQKVHRENFRSHGDRAGLSIPHRAAGFCRPPICNKCIFIFDVIDSYLHNFTNF